jgi:Ca2+/Na+ antiporter
MSTGVLRCVWWNVSPARALVLLAVAALVLGLGGVRFTRVVDRLADRTGIGEALAGAVLVGAVTSLLGLIASVVGAAEGNASFAVSNSLGGIAAQTALLAQGIGFKGLVILVLYALGLSITYTS